jgi:hypothetical protein
MYEIWADVPYEGQHMLEECMTLEYARKRARVLTQENERYGYTYFIRRIQEFDF